MTFAKNHLSFSNITSRISLIGFLIGLFHLPIVLQLSTSMLMNGTLIQSILISIYPASVALTGLGTVLAHKNLKFAEKKTTLRIAGACLLLSLFTALLFPFFTEETSRVITGGTLQLIAIGGWFTFIGIALGACLIKTKREKKSEENFKAWSLHLLGIVIGYICSEPIVIFMGANALLLIGALSLILLNRYVLAACVALVLAAPSIQLDQKIEKFRNLDGLDKNTLFAGRSFANEENTAKKVVNAVKNPDYLSWSRFGQFIVVKTETAEFVDYPWREIGLYNYWPQLAIASGDFGFHAIRRATYNFFDEYSNLAFIGTGAGQSMTHFRFPIGKNITAIERNTNTQKYYTHIDSKVNEGTLKKINSVAADGRGYIEQSPIQYDGIILESARHQKSQVFGPVTGPYYLYTKESVQNIMSKLKENGYFLIEIRKRSQGLPAMLYYNMLDEIKKIGYGEFIRFHSGQGYIIGCKSYNCVNRLRAYYRKRRLKNSIQALNWPNVCTPSTITDKNPFAKWRCITDKEKASVFQFFSITLALLFGFFVFMSVRSRKGTPQSSLYYFFLLGVSYSILQIETFYLWRSYFNDEVYTTLRLIIYFLIYNAIGSLIAGKAINFFSSKKNFLVLGLVVFAIHTAGREVIPFEATSPILRELAAAILLLPLGLFMGVFVPLGISKWKEDYVGRFLAADAVGMLAAYCIFFLVAVPFGIDAVFLVGVVGYILSISCFVLSAKSTASSA